MPLLLFVLFVGVPLIEIALFIEIGGALGTGRTLALIVATALLGAFVARRQGLAVLQNLRNGAAPLPELMHGVLILLAGACLITPGFFTDALGFLLLWRPTRRILLQLAFEQLVVRFTKYAQNPRPAPRAQTPRPKKPPPVIEGQFRVEDDKE